MNKSKILCFALTGFVIMSLAVGCEAIHLHFHNNRCHGNCGHRGNADGTGGHTGHIGDPSAFQQVIKDIKEMQEEQGKW